MLTFVLVIVANLIVYRLTRATDPDELTRWALMVLAVWVAQAIILNVVVKPLWSRPRMRVIEVTPGLNFQPWWVIGNPDKWSYIAAGVIKDGFKFVCERTHGARGDRPYARRASCGVL